MCLRHDVWPAQVGMMRLGMMNGCPALVAELEAEGNPPGWGYNIAVHKGD